MKRRKLVVSLLAFHLSLLGAIAPAIASDWELLGERNVRLITERDVINVNSKKEYAYLKLKVKRTGIEMLGMLITLRNGVVLNPPLRFYIGKDKETRAINLPGHDQPIRSVTLIYKSRPGSTEQALVQLYGKTK